MHGDILQVRIEIRAGDAGYEGSRKFGERVRRLKELRLSPDSSLVIHGQQRSLCEPVEALAGRRLGAKPPGFDQLFHERGQLDIGGYLYDQVFQSLTRDEREALDQAGEIELVIVSRDVFVCSIPWVLLSRNGSFLALDERERWSIALAPDEESLDVAVDFPRSPKMLIAAPNPATDTYPDTSGAEHVDELEAALHLYHDDLVRGRRLRVVDTWALLVKALSDEPPDVLYYYGHGLGNRQMARLLFPDRPEGVPVADLALRIQQLARKPGIVYLNCCHGDAGAGLGAGRQLAGTVAAVVSNRSLAYVPQARAQAVQFFQETLVQGKTPHAAMRKLYQPIREQHTLSNPRWLTPVFYRSYGAWSGHPATRSSWLPDPDWEAKLDRDTQWAMVFDKTCEMLAGGLRRGIAFLWYGEEGQGLDLFHQRLKIQLRSRLHQDVCLLEYRPHWPDDLGTSDTSYDVYPSLVEMYCRTFQVHDLSDVGGRVRQAADPQCPKKLVYIRHQVLTPRQALNLQFLQDYLSWWDATIPHMLGPGQFGLLGISYQAARGEDPEAFHDFIAGQLELEDQPYQQIDCHVLFRLKHVDPRHLRRFIDQIGFPLPANRREEILREIWEKSERGLYEKIIAELQSWLRRAYGARA